MRERPRDVYLAACAALADAFAPDGFSYAKSTQCLRRTRCEWVHRLAFQSSHRNAAGSVVKLWVHVVVENQRLESWRREHASPFDRGTLVVGGPIWNLGAGTADWNIADPAHRSDTLRDVEERVRCVGLPYVHVISDPDALLALLEIEDLPLLQVADATELALCYFGPSAAERFLNRWVERHPSVLSDARQRRAALASGRPVGRQLHSYAAQLALLAHHHGVGEAALTGPSSLSRGAG